MTDEMTQAAIYRAADPRRRVRSRLGVASASSDSGMTACARASRPDWSALMALFERLPQPYRLQSGRAVRSRARVGARHLGPRRGGRVGGRGSDVTARLIAGEDARARVSSSLRHSWSCRVSSCRSVSVHGLRARSRSMSAHRQARPAESRWRSSSRPSRTARARRSWSGRRSSSTDTRLTSNRCSCHSANTCSVESSSSFVVAGLLWAVLARDTGARRARQEHHTVRGGETLWTIATARYGGDPRAGVWKLQHANGPRERDDRPGSAPRRTERGERRLPGRYERRRWPPIASSSSCGARWTSTRYAEIRELWKTHSIAEDNRDLPGLISTLTEDCVYEVDGHGRAGRGTRARLASTPSSSPPSPISTSTSSTSSSARRASAKRRA